jgi:UDP-2,3-diacylglucosamine hydrolase
VARLFVSDVHLDADAPEATEQFLGFLAREAHEAEALYILGDLFEAWVGDDDQDPEKARVCHALRALGARGVACFALHGNRDFLLGAGFGERSGCRLLGDPVIVELDREPVLITHGDALCTDDHSYQELRSAVRSADWQRRFLALPLGVRETLSREARAGSRRHIARAVPDIMDVNEAAVAAAFRAARVRRMIHGHTHRPGVHEMRIDGAPAERIVLGAWYEQGSYLRSEKGRYELRTLPRPS